MAMKQILPSRQTDRRGQGMEFALGLGLMLLLALSTRMAAQEEDPAPAESASSLLLGAQDGFVDSGGVKIHYVSLGRTRDPLLVLIHGFPDFWYSCARRCPPWPSGFMSWRSTKEATT